MSFAGILSKGLDPEQAENDMGSKGRRTLALGYRGNQVPNVPTVPGAS